MEPIKIFKEDAKNEAFYSEGYIKFGSVSTAAVNALNQINAELDIPDYVGCDFNCGMNSDILEARKKMQENLTSILMPFFDTILDNFTYFSSSFVNKTPNDNFLILAHQDFTYTREPEIPSIMCWIPLTDVNIKNGAMGFVPKSHLFYDYPRAFPFPASYTPVVKNELELMRYLNIIDAKAGEMIFFFNNTIHGSFANYSPNVRNAININFVKKGEQIYLFIRNPKTEGKTLLKYVVENDFLVKYNNPSLLAMYEEGEIKIPYTPVEEVPFGDYDTGWNSVKAILDKHQIKPKSQNTPFVNRFKQKLLFRKIKEKIYYSLVNK